MTLFFLKCVFCWADDGQDTEAVTLLNGCAVCRFHIDRAAGLVRWTKETEEAPK